jgi:hypothetical protein
MLDLKHPRGTHMSFLLVGDSRAETIPSCVSRVTSTYSRRSWHVMNRSDRYLFAIAALRAAICISGACLFSRNLMSLVKYWV